MGFFKFHKKCRQEQVIDIIEDGKIDKTFYPVIYGIGDNEDWGEEKNWYKSNPSLGHTIDI